MCDFHGIISSVGQCHTSAYSVHHILWQTHDFTNLKKIRLLLGILMQTSSIINRFFFQQKMFVTKPNVQNTIPQQFLADFHSFFSFFFIKVSQIFSISSTENKNKFCYSRIQLRFLSDLCQFSGEKRWTIEDVKICFEFSHQ